jgi:hypothetical protein
VGGGGGGGGATATQHGSARDERERGKEGGKWGETEVDLLKELMRTESKVMLVIYQMQYCNTIDLASDFP